MWNCPTCNEVIEDRFQTSLKGQDARKSLESLQAQIG